MTESFGSSVASSLVAKLGEYLFIPIGRQFEYVLCYMSNVEDLKKEVEELETAMERVHCSVIEATLDGKPIYLDIKNWLDKVKKNANEARNLLKQCVRAKNACFREWLPNPMVRHPIGRKVKKMTRVIRELHNESRDNKFQRVYHENPPKGIVGVDKKGNTKDVTEDVMRALITEDVMKAILDDKIYVVGVYGPGGVGKSKLLEDVEGRVKKEKLFDVVVMAEVSCNPNIKTIQGDIADALGLKLMNVETARGRADRLRGRFERDKEKKILIILDNLHSKLELKDIGIPCGDDNKVRGCKLLLSSRNRGVLRIGMFSDQDFRLNELNDGEARRLFERTTGDVVYDSKFKPFVDGVVKNCGGLPLFIISLAKRLRSGKLAAWRNALILEGSDFKSLVEQNYNNLQDKRIKSLFLIYAISGQRILLRDALIYCLGVELFNNFNKTIEDARDRLIMDLDFLQDSSLLLDSDVTEEIRMHDIIANVAISIASLEWNALVGRDDCGFEKWSKDELRECTVISFPQVGIDELPEKLDCPNLRMFLLYENTSSLKIPNSFFESMEKLQVLDLSCLSITSLPSSIQFLKNLKSLCLDFCDLGDVTDLGKLKALQFLSLTGSTITRLPKKIGELIELRFLDLTGCIGLEVIEPGMLGSLIKLEELYIKDSFDKWEAENEELRSNANLTELKNMNKLSALDIAIPHSSYLPIDLPFGKLNKHKIQIGGVWDWSGEYKESRTLKLKLDSSSLLIEKRVLNCLQKMQDLHLDGLQHGVDSIHNLCIEGFQELKHLHVRNSPSFQNVVCSIENVECATFIALESLFLEHLNNLKEICRGYLALESFSKLKILKVDNCGEIKHLFPLSMKRIILQLEEIEISSCHLMQQIVANAEVDEDGDEISDDTKVKSCNLRRLTLRNLPKMTSFYKTGDDSVDFFDGLQVSLCWLESLTLSKLPKMNEILKSRLPSDVGNLKFLKVEDCAFCMSIFPSNLLIELQNLEDVAIERCQFIQKVFDLEGLTTSGNVEILSQLTTLTLSDLPRLEHIWNKNRRIALCFRNLRVLKVQSCKNLRFIFSSSMAKTLRQITKIKIVRCKLLEEIMDVQEEDSKKAASMHTLEFPLLSSLSLEELPNLRTFSHGTHGIHCPTLTKLRISGCPKMMAFSSFKGKQQRTGLQQAHVGVNSSLSLSILFNQKILFPSLEKLTVVSCGLMKIWHNEHSKESFRKLASITIQNCEKLSHIFPSNMIEVFQSLKMIEVVNCPSLESLIEHVAVDTKKRPKRLVFLNLNEVKLWDLPKLDALMTSSSQATLSLPNLTTVSLCNYHSLKYLFTYDTSGTLDKLEMLDVSDCNKMREVVAMEESEERKLKAMKFSRLQTLKLCSLKSLISFSSGNCAYEFPSLKNLSILECTKLKAFILRRPAPSVETVNEEFASFDESPHSLFDEKTLFSSLEVLTLMSLCGLMKIWHNDLSEEAFPKLASIKVGDCENLSHIFPSTSIERLWSLKRIEVVNCTSLEALIKMVAVNAKKRPKSLVFSVLEIVELCDLPMINAFVTSSSQATLSLPSLTTISLHRCPSLRYLFANDTSRTLDKLEVLDVSYCNKMQEVVAIEENEEQKLKAVKFSHLCTLKLYSLKSLISFYSGSCAYEFPSLRNLSILKCTELKAFILWLPTPRVETMNEGSFSSDESPHSLFNKKVVFPNLEELHLTAIQSRVLWENEMPNESICELKVLEVKQCPNLLNVIPSFTWKRLLQSMKSLIVEECPRVRNLFTMSMAKSLVQLKYLGLGGCGEMEYIVAKEEEKPEEAPDIIVIPQLVTLYLHKMIKLRSFCHGKHISKWPSLKEFTVEDCKAVEVILGDADCRRLQGSIPTQQPLLLVEKVEFPSMESMKISHMDNVEKIWLDELPSNAFTKLKKLIVEYCEKLSSIFSSDSVLTRFQNLEELKVTDCDSLEVVFQMQELNMSGSHSTSTFQLRNLKLERLQKMKHVWSGPPCGNFTFERLCCLKAKNCESLKSLFSVSIAKSMTQLEELLVQDCGVEEIIAVEGEVGTSAGDLFFPQLTDLRLFELAKLRRFYRNSHALTWPFLEKLRARHCGKMRLFSIGTTTGPNQHTLFPFEEVIPTLEGLTLTSEDVMMMMQQHHVFRGLTELELACYHDENVAFPSDFLLHRFPDLEKLSLSCSSLKEIFPEDACGHRGATSHGESTDMETPLKALKNLERLELNKLCKLQRVWKDGSLMAEILKRIETLLVSECSNLSIILPSPTAFQILTKLEVKDCAGLVHMGTSSAVTSLVHLTWLILRDCAAMEDVVTDDGKGAEDISFPELEELTLDGLPSLESFSPLNCALRFPLLERIVVTKCPKMNIFCKGVLSTPRLDEVCLSDEDYEGRWEGNLNTTIQFLLT